MSFICTVCRDLITPNAVNPADDNADIVVTKCGHLYHHNCLNGWFNNQNFPRLECPLCKSKVVLAELQRIFPSGDEETDEIINRYQDAKAQHGANRRLQAEIDGKDAQLIDTQVKYEEETLAHDLLRFEHIKFVEVVKTNVKTKIQQIQAKAEQEKQILLEEAEVFKLQVTTAMEKKDEENLILKMKIQELDDLVEALKQQRTSLRALLAESGQKDTRAPTPNQRAEESLTAQLQHLQLANGGAKHPTGIQDTQAVDICIQLLQKLKPKPAGVATEHGDEGESLPNATADLKQMAQHLVDTDTGVGVGLAPVIAIKKEAMEVVDLVSPMNSFIIIKPEPEDEDNDNMAESGAEELEEPDERNSLATPTSSDTSASEESTPNQSEVGGIGLGPNVNVKSSSETDSSCSPDPLRRSRSPSPSFADCLSSTVVPNREMDMGLVAGSQ